MKALFLLICMVFLASCASTKQERKIDDPSWDALADESFLRWGKERSKKPLSQGHHVVNCYQGEAKQTLKLFRQEYQKRKDGQFYWVHIGNCYFVEKEWQKAEFYYQLALEEAKSPTVKSVALNNLALVHFQFEEWQRGQKFLEQAQALAPKFKGPRFNLSQLYIQFGFYEKALEILTGPHLRGQRDPELYFSLANAYFYKGDLKSAGHYFSLIPKEQRRREDVAATYALYLMKKGDLKAAQEVMDLREKSGVAAISAIAQKVEHLLAARIKVAKDEE